MRLAYHLGHRFGNALVEHIRYDLSRRGLLDQAGYRMRRGKLHVFGDTRDMVVQGSAEYPGKRE